MTSEAPLSELERELVDALEQIAGYSEQNGMTRVRMRKIAKEALARAQSSNTDDVRK